MEMEMETEMEMEIHSPSFIRGENLGLNLIIVLGFQPPEIVPIQFWDNLARVEGSAAKQSHSAC